MAASRQVTFPSGIDYLVPTELIEYFARTGGEPEKALIEYGRHFLRPDGIFVDIGAHIGTYALSYAPSVRETHAFEPQRDTFHRLCGGIALRGNDSIHAHRVALSDDGGEAALKVLTSDGGLSSLCDLPTNKSPLRTETVPLATLDSYGLEDVCLVKIDVEGHELAVLRGALATLKRSDFPPLLVEVWTEAWFAAERAKLLEYLVRLGYLPRPAEGFPHMLVCEHKDRRQPAPDVVPAIEEDQKKKKRLLLTMIVRNETRVIARSLATMLPIVDGYVICDTGSVDGTPSLIKKIATEHGVRGSVFSTEWKNYGHNRTESADRARKWARERGWDLADTYLLFCDADMKLHAAHGFRQNLLQHLARASYCLLQGTPGNIYPNTRLARADLDWKSLGVTHEYWAAEGGEVNEHTLPQGILWLEDGNDGGNRSTKFERDKRLLEQGLADEPTNERYMFYLAQTYFDLGEMPKAAEMYERRYHAGGYIEEKMYARMKWGRALLAIGNLAGIDVLLRTFEEFPHRVDPLFYLAVHYREQGQNRIADEIVRLARTVPQPPPGGLFLEQDIYEWRLDWEESITAYYLPGARERGRAAADRVARFRRYGIPYDRAAENLLHYTEPLTTVHEGTFEVPPELLTHDGTKYESSSPTVVRVGNRLNIGVRLVNYDHAKGTVFAARDADGVIRTRELRAAYGDDGTPTGWVEIAQNIPADWPAARVDGLEDQRFVAFEGRVWFTANTWRTPEAPGQPQMVLGRLNFGLDWVDHLVPLRYAGAQSIEKNWLPFVDDEGRLLIVYGYDPFTVLEVNTESGECKPFAKVESPWAAHRFRGSAGPVAHPCKPRHWLVLVHEVAAFGDERVYSQRLLEFDGDYRPVALSAPFFIDHRGVEFPLGFVALDADHALITYGREERESRYAVVAWSELIRRLSP